MITVFIPTIPRSFNKLHNLIDIYNNGTLKPDEIIINASMVDNNNAKPLIELTHIDNVKVFVHKYKIEAGLNRQMANSFASGDIIMYQDDDDIPSNRRVEIIKYFFDNYDIVCLNHGYVYNMNIPDITNVDSKYIKSIHSGELYKKYFPNGNIEDCRNITDAYGGGFSIAVCAGPVAIKKSVLDTVKWKAIKDITLCKNAYMGRGEDYDFCMEVLYHYNKSILIDIPLYSYLK